MRGPDRFRAKNISQKKNFVCTGNVSANGQVSGLDCVPSDQAGQRKVTIPSRQPSQAQRRIPKREIKTHFNGVDHEIVQYGRKKVEAAYDEPKIIINVPVGDFGCTAGPNASPHWSPTIQGAIDMAQNFTASDQHARGILINVAPGDYDEFLDIDSFNSQINDESRDFDQGDVETSTGYKGFQIRGDPRPYNQVTYINGYEFANGSGRSLPYEVKATVPGTGTFTYQALLSGSFGGVGGVVAGTGIENSNNTVGDLGCTAGWTNTTLSGKVALISRGGCAFVQKSLNAQAEGAVAALIYQSIPGAPPLNMGGTSVDVTIPAFMISQADGLQLANFIAAALPGNEVTVQISALGGVYDPPLGSNFFIPKLKLNGAQDKITIEMQAGTGPIADDNILAPPVLDQPNLSDPTIGIVPGDRFILADSDPMQSSNYVSSIHTVTGITNGNEISFTPSLGDVYALTNVTASSDGQPSTSATINVASTAGFPSGGSLNLYGWNGNGTIHYTGKTATSFTGCTSYDSFNLTGPIPGNWPGDYLESLGVDLSLPGASMTFLPNVRVTKSNYTGLARALVKVRSQVSITGINFDIHPSSTFASISHCIDCFNSEVVLLSNIACTDIYDLQANGYALRATNTLVRTVDGYRGYGGRFAAVGWAGGILIDRGGGLASSIVFLGRLRQQGVTVSNNSNADFFILQIMGIEGLYIPGILAVESGQNCNINLGDMCHIADINGKAILLTANGNASLNTPALRIERIYNITGGSLFNKGGIVIDPACNFNIGPGYFYDNGDVAGLISDTSIIKDCFDVDPGFTGPNTGIIVYEGGNFQTFGQLEFSGNDDDYLVGKGATFETPEDYQSPGNTLKVDVDGVLDHAYEYQSLGSSVGTVTLDPSEKDGLTYLYRGKNYTILSDTNDKHCIQLVGGASFLGQGSNKVLKFNGNAGSYVRFKVVDEYKVLVEDMHGVNFSGSC